MTSGDGRSTTRAGDRIVLTIPRDEGFEDVAQLVLGGVASRLDLTYESLDDLGTGLASLLERRGEDGDLTVELRLDEDVITATIGPFRGDAIVNELGASEDGVGLRRVLDTVVDSFEALERPDGHWIEFRKQITSGAGS
jgi:hypothetical protein